MNANGTTEVMVPRPPCGSRYWYLFLSAYEHFRPYDRAKLRARNAGLALQVATVCYRDVVKVPPIALDATAILIFIRIQWKASTPHRRRVFDARRIDKLIFPHKFSI